MHRFMMVLSIWTLMLLQLNAEDTRDKLREEILKSFNEAEQARTQVISELGETVKSIEEARAQRTDSNFSETSTQTKIVESEEIAKIAHSVAKVEIAKVNAKENIKDGSKSIGDFLSSLGSYDYDYKNPEKHGEGQKNSVMAQELEKTDIGKQSVIQGEDGVKMVDYAKLLPAMLSGLAHQSKQIVSLADALKKKKGK